MDEDMITNIIQDMMNQTTADQTQDECLMAVIRQEDYRLKNSNGEDFTLSNSAYHYAAEVEHHLHEISGYIRSEHGLNQFRSNDLYKRVHLTNGMSMLFDVCDEDIDGLELITFVQYVDAAVTRLHYMMKSDKARSRGDLKSYYFILIQWDKNNIAESGVQGYNLHQFIVDSLAGTLNEK